MIRENFDRIDCARKLGFPFLKRADNGEQLFIIYVIIQLSGSKLARHKSDGSENAVRAFLGEHCAGNPVRRIAFDPGFPIRVEML